MSLFEKAGWNLRRLDAPIFYTVFYGPFSAVYVFAKRALLRPALRVAGERVAAGGGRGGGAGGELEALRCVSCYSCRALTVKRLDGLVVRLRLRHALVDPLVRDGGGSPSARSDALAHAAHCTARATRGRGGAAAAKNVAARPIALRRLVLFGGSSRPSQSE